MDSKKIENIEGVFSGSGKTLATDVGTQPIKKNLKQLEKMRKEALGLDIPITPKLKDSSKGIKVGINKAPYSYISQSKDFDIIKDNTTDDIYVNLKSRYTKSIEKKLKNLKSKYPKLIYNFVISGKMGRKGKSKLKQQHPELKEAITGSGIFDFLKRGYETVKSKIKETFSPRLDDFNNVSKQTIRQYGNLPIISLNIYRTPIKSFLNKALNLISFGKWDEVRNKYGYDKLFHLALVATVDFGKYKKNIIMEKNEVVNISTNYATSPETEVFNVNLNNDKLTPYEMLERARRAVGNTVFFSYDAFYNNCQFFIRYLLDYSDLYTKEAKEFLFQDLTELVQELPGYVPQIAKFATDTGAVVSKLRGEGKINKQPINKALGKTLVLYRGKGTEEGEQVKALSRGVVGLAENIPGVGTAVKALAKPITMATDAFTDYVLDPLFFDTPEARKRKEVKEEWADYIKDKSMRRYGVELTPEQFREINQEEKTLKTQAKNEALSKGIEDFEKVWREAGFKSAGEYRQAQRKARTEALRQKKLQGKGAPKSPPIPRKYLDEADKVYERPSLYRSSYAQKLALENDPEYRKKYEEYMKTKEAKKGGLARWYKEEWVNVKEYLKGNKMVCGSFKETRERPACRPLIRVNDKTPITLPEILEKGVSKKRILEEISKKEKNPDYRINWNKLK
jgi:hypothetical protein